MRDGISTLGIMRKPLAIFPLLLLLSGCRDSDVTSSPNYNFSSFSGTEWKTKVKVAVADIEGKTCLIAPISFDQKDPHYTPAGRCKVIAVLPVGSRIRIGRLMKDNTGWGGVRVTATLEDGSFSQRTVYVAPQLLAENVFYSHSWGVDTNMLEKP